MREWLGGMFAVGYLDYDAQQPASGLPTWTAAPGQALIALARAFPSLTAIGYDVHPQGHLRPG